MKKYILILILMICIQLSFGQKKKVVFIIVDGISADVIEKLETPNLDRIAREGAFIKAFQGGEKGSYSESPTISAVGYNNVLTGSWYNKHNVPDNDIKNPNYNYHTIFRFVKDQHPEKSTAIFSSWQDNRTKLVGEGLPQTGNIKLDYHFDGLELDTAKYPHDRARDFMARIDQDVAGEAANYIRQNGPDLSWVYLEYTDDMGHMFGDSEKFYNAVKMEDKLIGKVWEAIEVRRKDFKEDWMIVVTTDHGRDAKTGKNHGGQSDRERSSWIVTNAAPLNQYAKSPYVSVVDILPTIARFMDVSIPSNNLRELDGIPLVGKVSLAAPKAVKESGKIRLGWTPLEETGVVKIFLTNTNQFKAGKEDNYRYIGEVPLEKGSYEIDLKGYPASGFYKVVLEGPQNTVNRWIVTK